ncbi:MAG TPA: hypothetical protein VFT29_20630 [Gemmatimonadaceae bacterium]|nr:hypothetical protein [Gemmatimonadaceae bacterium]
MPTRAGWSLALAVLFAADARGQRLQLELRPRAGDTLRMRLDQVTEMSGGRRGNRSADPPKPVVTTLEMFSRAIVESSAATSTIILAVTDSVSVRSTNEQGRSMAAATERQLAGRKLRLRVSPDGTVGVADPAGNVPREVSELVAVMPASFPREPVAIGETWVREMPISSGPSLGMLAGGVVRASFRLDSVTRGGDLAYVSMRGTLDQVPTVAAAVSTLSGLVNGVLVVNRRRGWLSESRFLVDMSTTVMAKGVTNTTPMQFRMKITQHMRVVDKR